MLKVKRLFLPLENIITQEVSKIIKIHTPTKYDPIF